MIVSQSGKVVSDSRALSLLDATLHPKVRDQVDSFGNGSLHCIDHGESRVDRKKDADNGQSQESGGSISAWASDHLDVSCATVIVHKCPALGEHSHSTFHSHCNRLITGLRIKIKSYTCSSCLYSVDLGWSFIAGLSCGFFDSAELNFAKRIVAIPQLAAELAVDETMAKYLEIVYDAEKTRMRPRTDRHLPLSFKAQIEKILPTTMEARTRIWAVNDGTAQGPARSMAIKTGRKSFNDRRCDGRGTFVQ